MSPPKKKSHGIKRKRSLLRRLLNRHLTAITSMTTLLVFWLFLSPYFWKNSTDPIKMETLEATKINSPTVKNKAKLNEINKLTKELLAEQQKTQELTQELNNQSIELKDLLKKALVKAENKDKKYIDAINKIEKNKKHENNNSSNLGQTDYYNKVRISLSTSRKENQLQNKVNTFIEHKLYNKDNEIKYIRNLTKESEVRKNEVRSITLKKGETLWSIAKRAYGKGHLYPKILKANPQITNKNIKQLQTGTKIRVPL